MFVKYVRRMKMYMYVLSILQVIHEKTHKLISKDMHVAKLCEQKEQSLIYISR